MGDHLSQGVENLLHVLSPWGRPEGESVFPAGLKADVPRAKDEDSARTWFVRVVDTVLEGNVQSCAVEPQLGLFASLRWREGDQLQFVRMHALVCEGTLEELYWDEAETLAAYYLRLDYDLSALGGLFSHPQPHVHVTPWKFALRFPADMAETGNVVMDFLDFIYRNFFHDRWMDWARATWAHEADRRVMQNLFEPISEAFRASKPGVLSQPAYAESLRMMKRTLRERRDSLFSLRVPLELSRLLSLNP
jgi:hypothetical protein